MSAKFSNVLCYKCTWYSWQHLDHSNSLVRSVYQFHHSGIPLAHEDCFSKVKSAYNKSAYYSRPGREWLAISPAHAHTRHILFSSAIIVTLNFV